MKVVAKIAGALGLLLVIVFAGGIGKLVGKWSTDRFFEGKESAEINSVLTKTANQINKDLPMMVDANTRLDSTSGINSQFLYKYTLVNLTASQITAKTVHDQMDEKIRNFVCTNKETAVLVDNGVTFVYAYYGKKGAHIASITVAPSECMTR